MVKVFFMTKIRDENIYINAAKDMEKDLTGVWILKVWEEKTGETITLTQVKF